MSKVTIGTFDRSLPVKETSMTFPAPDAITDPQVQAVVDAVDAIILGTDASGVVTIPNIVDVGLPGPAASNLANRGDKWMLRTSVALDKGGAGSIYKNEIGTADGTQLPSSSNDFLDLTAGLGLALKAAWEIAYESPDGNPGILLSVQQVNRAAN